MSLICKSGFEDFAFLIYSREAIGKFLKIMIFVNKIDNALNMA